MSWQERPSEYEVRQMLPVLEEVLQSPEYPCYDAGKKSVEIKTYQQAGSDEERSSVFRNFDNAARILQASTVSYDNGKMTVMVDEDLYEKAMKPRFNGEPVADRVDRVLRRCGYDDLADKLKDEALRDVMARFGRGGSGPAR